MLTIDEQNIEMACFFVERSAFFMPVISLGALSPAIGQKSQSSSKSAQQQETTVLCFSNKTAVTST